MAIINANFTTQMTGAAIVASTVNSDLLRVNDSNPDFNMLNSEDSVLYRIFSLLMREEDATQPQFQYFEDDLNAVTDTVNMAGNLAADGDTLVMDNSMLAKGQVIFNPRTNDAALVTVATSAPSYTIERNYMGTTGAIWLDGDTIAILPAVLEDGGAPKDWVSNLPTLKHQMCSFVSQAVKSTDLQEATNMLNGAGQLSSQYAKCTTDLMRKMNLLIRHSKLSLDTGFAGGVTTNAAYHTNGLEQLITTNSELPIAGLDWETLNEKFNPCFVPTSSSMEKMVVLSQYAYSRINNLVWGHFVEGGTPTFQKTFGALMSSVQLDGGGILHLVADKHSFYPSNLGKQGYVLDMPNVGMKKMRGFDLSWREVPKDEYRTEKHELSDSIALMLKHASLHRTLTFA